MKKILILISLFVGVSSIGLRAEDAPATVSLPTAPTPAPEPAAANPAPAGDATPKKSGHKGHKKHHKKKASDTTPSTDSATPAPKS